MSKTPQELATAYADFATISDHTYTIAYHSYLGGYDAGYSVAYEKLSQHIQSLESQLRQANGMVMKLEAEK
jgi:hypothetical protein